MRVCRAMAMFRPSFIALIMNLTPEDLIFMETCFQRTVLVSKLVTFNLTDYYFWVLHLCHHPIHCNTSTSWETGKHIRQCNRDTNPMHCFYFFPLFFSLFFLLFFLPVPVSVSVLPWTIFLPFQEFEKLISFSGTPTVVWRRTGEIALVGKEFSLLTQWSRDQLLNKKTYIYELMDNQSAVEYWEKFSTHAFENTEQTVMTTCILLSPTQRVVPCTFCFTIKRDIFDIPLAIVGNFLPILS